MDREHAKKLATGELGPYREIDYLDLERKVGMQESFERITDAGESYQVEIGFVTDSDETKAVRVMAMVSYTIWTSFAPVGVSFIRAPDGSVVDE